MSNTEESSNDKDEKSNNSNGRVKLAITAERVEFLTREMEQYVNKVNEREVAFGKLEMKLENVFRIMEEIRSEVNGHRSRITSLEVSRNINSGKEIAIDKARNEKELSLNMKLGLFGLSLVLIQVALQILWRV